jgi:hypothetical protein
MLYGVSVLAQGWGFFRLARGDRALERELGDETPIDLGGGAPDGTPRPTPTGQRSLSDAVSKPLRAQVTGGLTLKLLGIGGATGGRSKLHLALYLGDLVRV